jgi:hypothetical protein
MANGGLLAHWKFYSRESRASDDSRYTFENPSIYLGTFSSCTSADVGGNVWKHSTRVVLVLYSCQLWTIGATRATDFRGTVGIVKGQCSGLAQAARYRSGKVVEVPKCIGNIGPIGDRRWNGAR